MSINNEPQANPNPSLKQQVVTRLKARGIHDVPMYVEWLSERNEWIHSEVTPLLDQVSPIVDRDRHFEWRHCPNPAHQDQYPSFYIAYDVDLAVGVPHCSCGIQHENHPWDVVAEWVGAEPFIEWWNVISITYMQMSFWHRYLAELSTVDENHKQTNLTLRT